MLWLNYAHANTFMPVQASEVARNVDQLYAFLLIASFISCVLVIGGTIVFALKYRRTEKNSKSAYISHSASLEFLWSFIPLVIFMVAFVWGWLVYNDMRTVPENPLEIHVTAQKWFWDFTYKNGRTSTAELYVPLNRPVKLIMTSKDVIHSFFLPGFRVKQDVIPGRYTALWFNSEKVGDFQVFCTEYCGDQHSSMLAKLHVLPEADFEQWLKTDVYKGLSLAGIGQQVFSGKCTVCHNITTEKKIGPGLADLFGKSREFDQAGSVVADENYIRESILNPGAKIVKGFPAGAMPTFAGQLSEQELIGVVEYIKSLK